ncbi:MAG: PEP-CTERM/exosortase system-associated acyltransferase [Candidatus Omnitrophota bacterium]
MLNFIFKLVKSARLLEEIYRLRFEVYVKENGFISCEDCPDGKEKDKFDEHSIHIAAIDKRGILAGAVRLALDSPYGFPIEEHCHYPIFNHKVELSRKNLLEISRLVISRDYRIGKWDDPYHVVIANESRNNLKECKCNISPILFGLYGLAYQESKRRGLTHWLAAMEDSLFRLVALHGFIFSPLGAPIDYYGEVTPYLGELSEIEKSVRGLKLASEDIFHRFFEPASSN